MAISIPIINMRKVSSVCKSAVLRTVFIRNISSCTAVVRKIVKRGLEKTRFDSTIVLEFLNKLLQINIGKALLLYARRNIGFAIN